MENAWLYFYHTVYYIAIVRKSVFVDLAYPRNKKLRIKCGSDALLFYYCRFKLKRPCSQRFRDLRSLQDFSL